MSFGFKKQQSLPLFVSTLLFLAGFLFNVATAQADTVEPATSDIYIAFLFHKMTGKEPDFESWAKLSPSYRQAKDYDKEIIFSKKTDMLRDLYDNIKTDDFITIHSTVNLNEYSAEQQTFFFKNFRKDTFFSFLGINKKIALIPQGIERYSQIKALRDDARKMQQKSHMRENAFLELTIRPVAADATTPITLQGEEHWLLMGKIAAIRIWSYKPTDNRTEPELLWFDGADWFLEENPLNQLYRE